MSKLWLLVDVDEEQLNEATKDSGFDKDTSLYSKIEHEMGWMSQSGISVCGWNLGDKFTFDIWSVSCLGNATDGFEVNDRSNLNKKMQIAELEDDESIISRLIYEMNILHPPETNYEVEDSDPDIIFILSSEDQMPLIQLIKE